MPRQTKGFSWAWLYSRGLKLDRISEICSQRFLSRQEVVGILKKAFFKEVGGQKKSWDAQTSSKKPKKWVASFLARNRSNNSRDETVVIYLSKQIH